METFPCIWPSVHTLGPSKVHNFFENALIQKTFWKQRPNIVLVFCRWSRTETFEINASVTFTSSEFWSNPQARSGICRFLSLHHNKCTWCTYISSIRIISTDYTCQVFMVFPTVLVRTLQFVIMWENCWTLELTLGMSFHPSICYSFLALADSSFGI